MSKRYNSRTSPVRLGMKAAILIALAATWLAPAAFAEDIDIYADPLGAGSTPNVLIVLDSSANWSSNISSAKGPQCSYYKYDPVTGKLITDSSGNPVIVGGPSTNAFGSKMAIEQCALYNLIGALPVNSDGSALFNVGIMLLTNSTFSVRGGYPRKALTPLTAANKAAFQSLIAGLDINNDKGNNAAFALALYESYLYLGAAKPYAGTWGSGWDHAATVGGSASGNYISSSATGCNKSYVILIANGSPQGQENNTALSMLKAAGGNTTKITYPNSYVSTSDQANWADEMSRFMHSANLNPTGGASGIVTFGVAVVGAPSDGLYPNFISSIAKYGGTTQAIQASDATTLTSDLQDIFTQIQSVSSVFAAASLPVSTNTRGTYLNQVFMGMFLPDPKAQPRWNGNLKQYQFAYDPITQTLSLVDQFGKQAISGVTGFISPVATSFWTTSSSFWVNNPLGTPQTASDSPDGEVVAKGAAAEVLRSTYLSDQSNRQVFACVGCSSRTQLGSTTLFNTGNTSITTALLGASSSTERDNIINWVRGTDNKSPTDELGPGSPTTIRPSVHGDVLHSRPAVVNYGGTTGVVVFYGANDGMLHAINGNQKGGGAELWSFVPEEGLPKLKRLRDNSPLVHFPNVPLSIVPTPTGRDYFVDGPISIYQKYDSHGNLSNVYMYFGMRRGGRTLYAFDVTTPTAPTFLWKKTQSDIPVLGQTWSNPVVVTIKGNSNPVLVMGAGYDAAEDADPAGTVTMGNAVLVLDAVSGTLLKSFTPIDRPVPADVSLVDSDNDGYVDRGYAVDLGGNIYRIDFESGGNSDPGHWQLNKLAALGSSGGQKFFFGPDVVVTTSYTIVMVGSGDREKPLKTVTSDYFYTVLDKNPGKGVASPLTPLQFSDLVPRSSFTTGSTQAGCYIAMDTAGEKVVNAALTIGGTTYFGTNKPTPPSPTSCTSNLGQAQIYSVPLLCQAPTKIVLNGGGLPPSPVGGIVQVTYKDSSGNSVNGEFSFIIGGGADNSGIQGQKVTIPITPKRSRLYWYYESAH